jgi:hypothetical protein
MAVEQPEDGYRRFPLLGERARVREVVKTIMEMTELKQPAPRYPRGVLAKYAAHVTSASLGAVTDDGLKL